MNIVTVAQFIGVIAIFLFCSIQFYITLRDRSFLLFGRTAIVWTTFYVFELFFLRVLQLIGIGTLDELRIITGFSALIPLLAILIHMFLVKTRV